MLADFNTKIMHYAKRDASYIESSLIHIIYFESISSICFTLVTNITKSCINQLMVIEILCLRLLDISRIRLKLKTFSCITVSA